MRLLQFLFVTLFYGVQSDCYDIYAKKLAPKEKILYCRYVIRNFKPKTRTLCILPENKYEDVYKNYSIANNKELYNEYQPCMDWLAGIIFNNFIYAFIIIIYVALFIRYPWF